MKIYYLSNIFYAPFQSLFKLFERNWWHFAASNLFQLYLSTQQTGLLSFIYWYWWVFKSQREGCYFTVYNFFPFIFIKFWKENFKIKIVILPTFNSILVTWPETESVSNIMNTDIMKYKFKEQILNYLISFKTLQLSIWKLETWTVL